MLSSALCQPYDAYASILLPRRFFSSTVQKNAALPGEAKKRPTEYAAMAIDLGKAGPRRWNQAGKNGGY